MIIQDHCGRKSGKKEKNNTIKVSKQTFACCLSSIFTRRKYDIKTYTNKKLPTFNGQMMCFQKAVSFLLFLKHPTFLSNRSVNEKWVKFIYIKKKGKLTWAALPCKVDCNLNWHEVVAKEGDAGREEKSLLLRGIWKWRQALWNNW